MSALVDEYVAHGGVCARALWGRPEPSQEGVGAVRAHSSLGQTVPLRDGASKERISRTALC